MARSLWTVIVILSLLSVSVALDAEPALTAESNPAGLAEAATRAPSTVIAVTTTNDELNNDGDCSLREAIQAANTDTAVSACPAGSGNDTIILQADIYTLSIGGNSEDGNAEGDLDVTGVLTVAGASSATTIIQGGPSAFSSIDRVFHVLDSSGLTVQNLTIRYGQNFYADWPHKLGGGVYVAENGLLNINNSILADNRSFDGGGVYVARNGLLNINNGILTDNEGTNGGAIVSHLDTTVNINNSIISNNNGGSGGGGLLSWGVANINNTTFYENMGTFGGAIEAMNGPVNITNSTISSNRAYGWGEGCGGAIQNQAVLSISNSTLSGNTALYQGGGIRNFGTLYISNSTFTDNEAPTGTGGGIFNYSYGTVTMTNSIIANNIGGNCNGTITDAGDNIDSGAICGFNPAQGSMSNTDPRLGPLADNGGPTLTHALLPGSPAINTGDCSGGTINRDQRGVPRPLGGACDIGAYESPYESPPDLMLYGRPGDGTIYLDWIVHTALPVTTTWHIDYYNDTMTSVLTATDPLSTTRAHMLPGLTNYATYTVTLHAMVGPTSFLSDTVHVMPTDKMMHLPLLAREH